MNKDRDRQGTLSCLAAMVLLAQLLLAATHVHSSGEHGIAPTASAPHGASRMPAGPVHQGDEFCPLCWGQAAAGTLLVPPAIALRLPADLTATRLIPAFRRLAEHTTPSAFQPRAPPA